MYLKNQLLKLSTKVSKIQSQLSAVESELQDIAGRIDQSGVMMSQEMKDICHAIRSILIEGLDAERIKTEQHGGFSKICLDRSQLWVCYVYPNSRIKIYDPNKKSKTERKIKINTEEDILNKRDKLINALLSRL